MKNNSVGLLELETAVLECFLEKTPISPLGVKGQKDMFVLMSHLIRMFDFLHMPNMTTLTNI
jgi:hypothetical protein